MSEKRHLDKGMAGAATIPASGGELLPLLTPYTDTSSLGYTLPKYSFVAIKVVIE